MQKDQFAGHLQAEAVLEYQKTNDYVLKQEEVVYMLRQTKVGDGQLETGPSYK